MWAVILSALLFVLVAVPVSAADVTVQLSAQSSSGESGTATLSDMGANQTKVTLKLTGAPAGTPQPAHVHVGTCATLDPSPKYPLKSVENGESETVLDVSLDTLTAGNLAINVHKSASEASVYVACGNISSGAGATGSTSTTATAPAGMGQIAPKAGAAHPQAQLFGLGIMFAVGLAAMAGGMTLRRRALR
jgi:hypothetical protein